MVTTLGRQVVAPPSITPARFGLLSVATLINDGDQHWEAGIEWEQPPCGRARTTGTAGTCAIVHKSPSQTGQLTIGADPFTVYAWISCSPVGSWDTFTAMSDEALTNGEGRAVEHVFWTGLIDDAEFVGLINPHLAANAAVVQGSVTVQLAATVVTTGAPVDLVEGLGLLEGALAACYPGEGVIHVPRVALASMSAWQLIERDGQQLRTKSGNLVAAYSSNDLVGPTGAAPAAGTGWIYATGGMTYRRSEIRHTSMREEALDRSENTMIFISERTYVVNNHGCCQLAAQISLTGVA